MMIWQTLVLPRVGLQGDRPINTLLVVVDVHFAQYGYLHTGGGMRYFCQFFAIRSSS